MNGQDEGTPRGVNGRDEGTPRGVSGRDQKTHGGKRGSLYLEMRALLLGRRGLT